MQQQPHPFDAATHLELLSPNRFRGHTSAAYANMVGPFGGVTAACLLQAPLQHEQRLGDPIALTVNFAAAVTDGEFEVVAKAVRTNRSTQHWSMELHSGGHVATSATAVFAVRPSTWSATDVLPPELSPSAETLERTPPRNHLAWPHRYDMRFIRGGVPDHFDGQEQADAISQVWVRDEPPRPLDFASLAALCDSFFPRVILRRRKVVPIGTVTLSTYFHGNGDALREQGTRHLLCNVRGVNYRNGYFDQSAEVWSADGQLLASTHQLVYFRE